MYTNMNNFVSKLLRYIERKQFEEKPSFFFFFLGQGGGFHLCSIHLGTVGTFMIIEEANC